ncbi:hypothetical protein GBF35_24665 [Nonomuraea phyllanthi]|nr:hypothetical protein GBF35_24665 [Nonomuraea phyllanthi]
MWTTPTETFDSGGVGVDGFPAPAKVEDRGSFVVVDHGAAASDLAMLAGGLQAVGADPDRSAERRGEAPSFGWVSLVAFVKRFVG